MEEESFELHVTSRLSSRTKKSERNHAENFSTRCQDDETNSGFEREGIVHFNQFNKVI